MNNFKDSMNAIEEGWITVSFNWRDRGKIRKWIDSHSQSRHLISSYSVRFENPHDATYFKLRYGK